jgi:hypothetical protein
MSRIFVFAMLAFLVIGTLTAAKAEFFADPGISGVWTGTWFVDAHFNSSGNPVGTPPFPTIDLMLDFTPGTATFGTVSFGAKGGPTGDIIDLLVSGPDVTMTVDYSPYSDIPKDPAFYAHISGILNGDTLIGNYDEPSMAPPGWIYWQGPFAVTLVPDPATACLLALGAIGLVWRSRPRL